MTEFARSYHIPILATTCAHLPDDPELTQFSTSLHDRHTAGKSSWRKRFARTPSSSSRVSRLPW